MKEQMERLLLRYPQLQEVEEQIENAYKLLEDCYENGHRVYVCGNGGSASDCEHIVGELMKSFRLASLKACQNQLLINFSSSAQL